MILAGDFIPRHHPVRLPEEFRQRITLANLEGPICIDGLPCSNKVGVCLHTALSDVLSGSIGRFAFSLANNHMMDYREEGLHQTRNFLSNNGIVFAGAGDCESEARRPMIIDDLGSKIAVFCCCERQFGMATEHSAGCAGEGVWLYDAIRAAKESNDVDFVVVSCHAANEFSPWVSPRLHDFYHSLIDAGADCVHGHHAHVPQGYEEYKGRPIFYGLGNFVVDPSEWKDKNQLWSLVANVEFGATIKWNVRPYSVFIEGDAISVGEVEGERKSACEQYLEAANAQFKSHDMLMACWQEFCTRFYRRLYSGCLRAPAVVPYRLSGREIMRKIMFLLMDIRNILTLSERPTNKSRYYAKVLYNYFNCASHYESIAVALGVLTGGEPDFRTPETIKLADALAIDR